MYEVRNQNWVVAVGGKNPCRTNAQAVEPVNGNRQAEPRENPINQAGNGVSRNAMVRQVVVLLGKKAGRL